MKDCRKYSSANHCSKTKKEKVKCNHFFKWSAKLGLPHAGFWHGFVFHIVQCVKKQITCFQLNFLFVSYLVEDKWYCGATNITYGSRMQRLWLKGCLDTLRCQVQRIPRNLSNMRCRLARIIKLVFEPILRPNVWLVTCKAYLWTILVNWDDRYTCYNLRTDS